MSTSPGRLTAESQSFLLILVLVAEIQRPDVHRVKRVFQLKDLADWIPVTSTGMTGFGDSVFKFEHDARSQSSLDFAWSITM
jgi:hypothetical protein